MRIQEIYDIHFVLPKTEFEYEACFKTLTCVTTECDCFSDCGSKEKWSNFINTYEGEKNEANKQIQST